MPNPVVSFEIRGPDPARLRRFYGDVFGWETYVFPGGTYAGVETTSHTHNEATGATTYTGDDAFLNDGVQIGAESGHVGWKFAGETRWRGFEPGISGGIGEGVAAVTFYIQVGDLQAALDEVVSGGGAVVLPPTEVAPGVFIATFADPAGNVIGLNRAVQAPDGA